MPAPSKPVSATFTTARAAFAGVLGLASVWSLATLPSSAQVPPVNGMRPTDLRGHAIVDATVIPAPGQKIEHATILIRDGIIQAVGPNDQVQVPAGARVWKAEGMTVYPGLIESALLTQATASTNAGSHWNGRIRPEINMAEQPAVDQALRKELRGLGFTAAAVYPSTGAIRGTGALIALADENENALVYDDQTAMAVAFDYGGGGRRGGGGGADTGASGYPGSLMGAQALLRQTFHDAQWYHKAKLACQENPALEPPLRNDAMEAMEPLLGKDLPILFDATDELTALRGAKLLQEFKGQQSYMLLGSGYEFRQLNEILDLKAPVIVPLDFPRRPDVSTLAAADSVSLRDMMSWEQAPTNARRLVKGGAEIAFTTHRMRSRNEFHANLRSAIKHGLTEDQALAALTTTPAKLLGVSETMGTIEPGKLANLVVVKGNLFNKDAKIYDTWVNGRRYENTKDADVQLKGTGTITIHNASGQVPNGDQPRQFKIDVDTVKSTVTLHLNEKTKIAAKKVVAQQDQLSFVTDARPFEAEGYVRFSGVIEGNPPKTVTGSGALPDGSTFLFNIEITGKSEEAKPEEKKDENKEEKAEDATLVEANEPNRDPISGEWTIQAEQMEGVSITLTMKKDEANNVTGTASVMGQPQEISGGKFDPATNKVTYNVTTPEGVPVNTEMTITGDSLTGSATGANFAMNFTGSRSKPTVASAKGAGEKKEEEKFVMPAEELNYPLGEYGRMAPPQSEDFLVTNATIWTAGPQGIIKNGWMHVQGGKVANIGSGSPPGVGGKVIDAQGKHITPGLIDCHSHTGISGGVNEMMQTNTAECRIGDCINPADINWYRQLAGGLTACNQLHGSANPIGGQNSVVKLKFGARGGPDVFRFPGAISGIKFALGENVKRSQNRYPNTRMGVETFIRDAFTAAKEYKAKWAEYEALATEKKAHTIPPRRDLELDALVEILDGNRLVHCHSYRQDEILMLIRVADDFGFTIGTFQHVLEGFKVADAIAKHGAGASSFSDWWAYKVEVMDAVPYNGALMTNVGVLVSFNSDSDELARRMNTEAAKAVRYGGVDPHEALKFVTLNPAKQLKIDNRVGSLEKGKDADFVIWSGDPLSTYTRCEQTWIEGAKYFDIEEDKELRKHINAERQRLIQKILAQAHGDPTKPGEEKKEGEAPAAGEGGEGRRPGMGDRPRRRPPNEVLAWLEEQVRLGRDPNEARPGVCGCSDHMYHEQE